MINTILLIAEIASAVSALIGILVAVRKFAKWCDNITEGEKCHLRSDMLQTYYRHKAEKRIRQYERENFDKLFKAYRALGGNSFIEDIYKEVKTWTIES